MIRHKAASNEVDESAFVLLLREQRISNLRIRKGPEYFRAQEVRRYIEKNNKRSILSWIDEDGRVVSLSRKDGQTSNAETVLRKMLSDANQIEKLGLSKAIKNEISKSFRLENGASFFAEEHCASKRKKKVVARGSSFGHNFGARRFCLKASQIHYEKERADDLLVPVERLTSAEHGVLLCYPGLELDSFNDRLSQLRGLGVSDLILEGNSKVGKYGVIGKGCVSIVVKARLDSHSEPIALKIRRADANRPDMGKDYELQRFANSFGVGPKAYGATKDFFAMEYVDSIKIGKWFESIRTRTPKKYLKGIVRNILEQCFLLDINHLDHGELSNPSKHILIRNGLEETRTVIIDYESASRERKPSNLTAVAAFLFLGSWQSDRLRGVLGSKKKGGQYPKNKLIKLFGEYKQKPNREGLKLIEEYLRI